MKSILFGTLIALGFAAVIGLAIGAWYLKRTINYNLMYKECVQQTVKEMVKAECLK